MFSLLTDSSAWAAFLTLAVIEIVLGVDNLVFLAVMVARLPPEQQRLARQIGLLAAMLGRVVLLLSIVWLIGLNVPFAHPYGFSISGRTVILALGGFFLVHKSVTELCLLVKQNASDTPARQAPKKFLSVLFQIFLLDLVFSLDSVFTAVGLVQHIPVMIAANLSGGTTKPNCVANGVNGNAAVITNASKLNDINSFPGMLFSNDLCVLTTNRINNSVQIDSMNHPVWNISASALNNLYSA